MPNGCGWLWVEWGGKRQGGAGARNAIVAPTMPRLDDAGGLWADCVWLPLKMRCTLARGGRVRGLGRTCPVCGLWGDWGDACPCCGSGAPFPNYNDNEYHFWAFNPKNRHLDFVCRYVLPTSSHVHRLAGMSISNAIQTYHNNQHLIVTHCETA